MSSYNPFSDIIEEYQIGDNKTLKIGVIGDTQLINEYTEYVFYQKFQKTFRKSLEILKEKKINVLIIDGDITNVGESSSYDNTLNQFNSVYGNEKKRKYSYIKFSNGKPWLLACRSK